MDLMLRRSAITANDCGIAITWDASLEGNFLRDNDSVGINANTHVSNYLPLPAGNYTFSFKITDLTAATYRIHEYNENGEWIRMVAKFFATSTSTFIVNFETSGKFIRISAPKATVDCRLR